MLLGFLSDILEGWARVCCVHVFLVTTCLSETLEVDAFSSLLFLLTKPDCWFALYDKYCSSALVSVFVTEQTSGLPLLASE